MTIHVASLSQSAFLSIRAHWEKPKRKRIPTIPAITAIVVGIDKMPRANHCFVSTPTSNAERCANAPNSLLSLSLIFSAFIFLKFHL